MKRITIRQAVILKTVVAAGLLAQHFLPPEQAIVVSIASNLLWLVAF